MKGNSHSRGQWFTAGLVSAWYASNIGVLLLNKYLLSNYGFKYPIFLTLCHMTACSLLSYMAIVWFRTEPLQTIRSRRQFIKIAALSLIFCGSVVCGNVSLRYLPVSFTQAVGSTTPFFTALFAFLMTWKRESCLTYVTLVPVVAGVVIASGGEPSFHLFGFIMCIGATAARALKTVLGGILLSSEAEKLSSMNLLLYMAPVAVLFLLPATLLMEQNVIAIAIALAKSDIKVIWYLLLNSALAYLVNLTNFLVTKHTSPLTLQGRILFRPLRLSRQCTKSGHVKHMKPDPSDFCISNSSELGIHHQGTVTDTHFGNRTITLKSHPNAASRVTRRKTSCDNDHVVSISIGVKGTAIGNLSQNNCMPPPSWSSFHKQ